MKYQLAADLAYDESGAGGPVILLHGNFTSRQWWSLVARCQPPGLRLLMPDLPGHGDSPMPEGEVSIERYARNILSFADALHLETFHLVGVSLGGATAEGVAGLAPHRLRGLMLVDAPAPDGLITPEERYPVLEAFRGQAEMLRVALGAVTPFCQDRAWFDDAVAEALRMHPRLFTENARAIAAMDFRATLPAYAGPALAIRGRADYLVTDAHQEAIRQALPQLQIEVWEDAGHSPPSDQPERFAARLAEFCRRNR